MSHRNHTGNLKSAFQYIASNSASFIEELSELCKYRSVSGDLEKLEATAHWLAAKLQGLGAETNIINDDGGIPMVFGKIDGESSKTLLIYNYYDVVSEGELSEWESSPFSPEVRNGRIYARGVDSNKGNLLARIHAVESYLKNGKRLPVTIKFLFEGGEESGSPHLPSFFKKHKDLLKADGCLWAGERRDALGQSQIALGTKGLLYLELHAEAKRSDMHASFATVVPNPAVELTNLLAGLVDTNGRCNIKGFYDPVRQPSKQEKQLLTNLSANEEQLKTELGLNTVIEEKTGEGLLVRHLYKPTCTICGFHAGHTASGMKTVLPNKAVAKLDFRLVADQKVDELVEQIENYLQDNASRQVTYKVLAAMDPAKTSLSSTLVKAAYSAVRKTEDFEPVILPTSPVSGHTGLVHSYLGASSIAVGVGDTQSNPHGPNESINVGNYMDGIRFVAALLDEFANEDGCT